MAYTDDKDNNRTHPGDDAELEEILASLNKAKREQSEADTPSSPEDEPAIDETPIAPESPSEPIKTQDKLQKGGSSRAAIVVISVVLMIALIAALIFGVTKLAAPKVVDENAVPTSSGEIVTINDSVMGEIELQTVKGAEVNTYTAENLVTDENGYYAYYKDGKKISHLGIDLSDYQGEVDFEAVKNAGVEFVMLRIGGRYYGDEGALYEDSAFDTYYQQAKAAGLKVGAYFFSQSISVEDAEQEAEFTVTKLAGRQLDYPIAFDWENIEEEAARTDSVTGEQLTDIAEAFCDKIKDSGYKSIVYSNSHQMFILYDFETMKDYDFWLADYRDFPEMYYNFDMWQYSTDGVVNGVQGTVDMNISFTDFTE